MEMNEVNPISALTGRNNDSDRTVNAARLESAVNEKLSANSVSNYVEIAGDNSVLEETCRDSTVAAARHTQADCDQRSPASHTCMLINSVDQSEHTSSSCKARIYYGTEAIKDMNGSIEETARRQQSANEKNTGNELNSYCVGSCNHCSTSLGDEHDTNTSENNNIANGRNIVTKAHSNALINGNPNTIKSATQVSIGNMPLAKDADPVSGSSQEHITTNETRVNITADDATTVAAEQNPTTLIKVYDEHGHCKDMTTNIDGAIVNTSTANVAVVGDICVFTPKNREKGRRKVEARTAKMTAVAVLVFVLFWLPYPSVIIYLFTIPDDELQDQPHLFDAYYTCVTITIFGSAVNPIVYGMGNPPVRKEFIEKCKRFIKK